MQSSEKLLGVRKMEENVVSCWAAQACRALMDPAKNCLLAAMAGKRDEGRQLLGPHPVPFAVGTVNRC